jgi:CRP/FNR family transcriptional regulator, cyclic AMP receptor protein
MDGAARARPAPGDLDSLTAHAWSESWLARLPASAQDELRAGALPMLISTGQLIYRSRETPRLVLLVDGMVRIFASSASGRHVTVRYVRPGDLLGAVSVVTSRQEVDAEAVTDSHVLFLNVSRLRTLASTVPEVGWVLSQVIGDVCSEVIDVMAANVFGSIRARLARHLLDLAIRQDGALVVRQDLQDMADAIGSVREVVGRTVRELRALGLVERRDNGIHLLDPGVLHKLAIS